MSKFITPAELFNPHFSDMPDVELAKATSIVSATTSTGATVVSSTVFAGDDSGVRSQSSWNDQGFSTVVGNALDQVVLDLTTAANKAQEIAGDLEQK
jgi:hypothetical protein